MINFIIWIRRLKWRLGRRLYMDARGEPRSNLPDSSDERYAQQALLTGTTLVSQLVVMDVGANKGQWSNQFLNLAPKERLNPSALSLHAFEPVPATRDLYRKTIAATPGHACTTLHSVALSDAVGKAEIAIWGETAGTNTLSFDESSIKRAQKILQIETVTLDNFLKEHRLDHVHLLKIDAEGHDFQVLKGAEESIRNECVDVVQFEYSHRWIFARFFLRDVFRFVEKTPYSLVRICADRVERLPRWHPELERYFDANFALVHPRAECWFTIHDGTFDHSNTYA